jgi:hypothetical protein
MEDVCSEKGMKLRVRYAEWVGAVRETCRTGEEIRVL